MTYREHLEDLRDRSQGRLEQYQQDETLGEYRQSLSSDERRRLRSYEEDLRSLDRQEGR